MTVVIYGRTGEGGETRPKTPSWTMVLLLVLFAAVLSPGCSSLPHRDGKERVLAVVEGRPVTVEDLEYSLQIAHRREDLSSAGGLDISGYVRKLVDDRLLINEARRMGLDEEPSVREAVRAFALRESVMKLYEEEISRKVSVTEEEIENYYRKNYEKFTVSLVELDSREEAAAVAAELKKGADSGDVPTPARRAEEFVGTRGAFPAEIGAAVAALAPGEVSGVLQSGGRYYVVKLVSREEAPRGGLGKVRDRIERALRKEKEKLRSDEYLAYLRERSDIKINEDVLAEVLAALGSDGGNGDSSRWSEDTRPLAEVNGEVLTVGEFAASAVPYRGRAEEVLYGWIDRKIVDTEALRRHYERDPAFKGRIDRYEDQILKRAFLRGVIAPEITLSEEDLKECYREHRERFTMPERFRLQQITVESEDEALKILRSLEEGAEFSWLARTRSRDSAAQKGGDLGWLTRQELSGVQREWVDRLDPGGVSGVFRVGSSFRIIRLQDREEGKVKAFEEVKNAVYKLCFRKRFDALLEEYVSRLRSGAKIRIYADEVKAFERRLKAGDAH